MTTAGPHNPSTVVDNGGGYSWSNPSNATSSNNSYAVADGISAGVDPDFTSRLKATGFGFAIPAGATILGIVAEIEVKASMTGSPGTSVDCSDNEALLVKAGTASGTNKSAAAGITTTDTYKSFGGPTDLWGLSLTPADVNSSDFGFQYRASFNEDNNSTISVDHIRLTVHYSLPSVACPFLLNFI